MKNFTSNIVDNVLISQSVEKLTEEIRCSSGLTWAALIDTAFDYGVDHTSLDVGPLINCYDFPELQGLKPIAPCLIELLPGSRLRMQIVRLIKHCQGRPMLSFVATTGKLNDISANWRGIHMVSVVDEQRMLLRFADTRVLSRLPHILTTQQWEAISGVLSYWKYFDRLGRLVTYESPDLSDRTESISITKEQLERLVDESYPDALMVLVEESMADIVPVDSLVSVRYCITKNAYELARKNKVDNHADILALVVSAYLTKGESNYDPRLQLLLQQRAWSIGMLGDAIIDAGIIKDE